MIDYIRLQNSSLPVFTPSTPVENVRTLFQSAPLQSFRKHIDRVLQWISKLEQQIDREEPVGTADLKQVKEQFQKHEVRDR